MPVIKQFIFQRLWLVYVSMNMTFTFSSLNMENLAGMSCCVGGTS